MGFPDQPRAGYARVPVNGMAIRSLVFGLAQVLLWWMILLPGFVSALIALVLGIVALRQISRRGGGGRGLAIAGVTLGALGVIGGMIWLLYLAFGSWVFTGPRGRGR